MMRTQGLDHGRKTRNTDKKKERYINKELQKESVKVSGTYYPLVSNIGSRTRLRTTSIPANTTVLRHCVIFIRPTTGRVWYKAF